MINDGKKKEADILIVDDVESDLLKLKEVVKNTGYKVRTAARGDEAIAMARIKCPDLILLDITMPDMNGIDALKRIRIIDPDAKIVICSALGQHEMVAKAIEFGAQDFIVKPFQESRLVAAVKKVLSQ